MFGAQKTLQNEKGAWMSIEEHRKQNIRQWDETLSGLFNHLIPEQAVWGNTEEIINVCNLIGHDHNLNHTFFPSGGGLDLYGAGHSVEPECIELHFGDSGRNANIIKPDRMIFQSFGAPYEWAYFRINTIQLTPSGVYEDYHDVYEELTETTRGNYVDRSWWDAGFFGHDEQGSELPLPKESRVIIRWFSGSLVIFAKGSTYNAVSETYDGRHSKMSTEEFREYIRKASDKSE